MMKLFLVASLILFGTNSFANFTGEWRGAGTLTTKNGEVFPCDTIIVRVKQEKDHLEFGKFYYGCGGLAVTFTPPTLNFNDQGNVTWQDQNVGQITDTTANLHFILQNNGRSRYTATMTSPTEMDYMDEQIDVDAGYEKVSPIQAKLYKVN
jgi:hypothetical protein